MSAVELAEIIIPVWILISGPAGLFIGLFIAEQNRGES